MASSIIPKALNGDISSLNDALSNLLIVTEQYSYQYSLAANGSTTISRSDFGITIPSGYIGAGIVAVSTGNTQAVVVAVSAQSSSETLIVRNTTGNALTPTARVRLLLKKS